MGAIVDENRRVSILAKKAIAEADRVLASFERTQEAKESARLSWMSKEDWLIGTALDMLLDFIQDDGEFQPKLTYKRINPRDPRSMVEIRFDVDGYVLALRSHYKAEYEYHPFETWGVWAVRSSGCREVMTHVASLAELGEWIRHNW